MSTAMLDMSNGDLRRPSRDASERLGSVAARRLDRVPASDAQLVDRAKSGDRWAEEALFRRYIHELTRVVTRWTQREQDADDIVQESFALALRDLNQLREPSAFRSWLYRIAINQTRKKGRWHRIQRAVGLDRSLDDATLDQLADAAATPEQVAELRLAGKILSKLPSDLRVAWMLRHVEGERLETVAELCGCSLATAKRRIAKAQSRLDVLTATGGDR